MKERNKLTKRDIIQIIGICIGIFSILYLTDTLFTQRMSENIWYMLAFPISLIPIIGLMSILWDDKQNNISSKEHYAN